MDYVDHDDNRAAIICRHIAKDGLPILCAIRSEPLREEDSGWQFLCYSGMEEDDAEAQVWAVDEVLAIEPTLSAFANLPIGTKLLRRDRFSPWVVENQK